MIYLLWEAFCQGAFVWWLLSCSRFIWYDCLQVQTKRQRRRFYVLSCSYDV